MIAEIDVKSVLSRSVCELYHDLVTRPTGAAVRSGIEAQLAEFPEIGLVVLDFSAVGVLDCSCADEVVAKLLRESGPSGGPKRAFFVFRGLSDEHADQIEAVLLRHGLALVAQDGDGRSRLLGAVAERERDAYAAVINRGGGAAEELAADLGCSLEQACRALESLTAQRVIRHAAGRYQPLFAA